MPPKWAHCPSGDATETNRGRGQVEGVGMSEGAQDGTGWGG